MGGAAALDPERSAAIERLVGSKAWNLGLMTAAGLPVPEGFIVTQQAYRESAESGSIAAADDLRSLVLAAYEELGDGMVAVRSSASGEDGVEHSFAGQQETILGVEGNDALLAAIERCWRSLQSDRAIAYRRANRLDDDAAAMAVVVQRLVPSEASGVLFTRNPLEPSGEQLLIEAAPGLGEAVVSGRVMPDRFHVRRDTGEIVDRQISIKRERLTAEGWLAIEPSRHGEPCLSDDQVARLAELAIKIEDYYGEPRDVEWAWAEGRFHVLQARPITALSAGDLEQARQREIARVRSLVGGRDIVWARYNLAEVLPTPTPLTWSIVKRFMSGRGGFGHMFRDLGYDPDPALDDAGFLDLICGRPYVNLDREPLLFFRDFPYGYEFAAIRRQPALGMYPQLTTMPAKKTSRFWWRLPSIAWRMVRHTLRIKRLMASEGARLRSEVYPRFAERIASERRSVKLVSLSDAELLGYLDRMIDLTLLDFARESLRPSVLAATALAELEQLLARGGLTEPSQLARRFVMGVRPDEECDLAAGLRSLAAGTLDRETFLARFGHRGSQEMELAGPRWSESPESLPQSGSGEGKLAHDFAREEKEPLGLENFRGSLTAVETAARHAREYLALREASKHYLMLGYAWIREILLEAARQSQWGDDLFFLTLEELPAAMAREPLGPLIAERKRERKLLLALAAPPVILSDDLEAIGRPVAMQGVAEWAATPLSFGDYEGEALVLEQPIGAESIPPGFVLVCPTTDPAWVPLFLKAGALVMESGGVLSHGAIVAREFGIPAVAGIADVHRQLKTGDRLRVDGTHGRVWLVTD
jgi:rifampicin phosphotransferase